MLHGLVVVSRLHVGAQRKRGSCSVENFIIRISMEIDSI